MIISASGGNKKPCGLQADLYAADCFQLPAPPLNSLFIGDGKTIAWQAQLSALIVAQRVIRQNIHPLDAGKLPR